MPKVAKNLSFILMLVFDWLEQTDKMNWVEYFACENDLCRAMLPDCLGALSSTLCQKSALKEAMGIVCVCTYYSSQMPSSRLKHGKKLRNMFSSRFVSTALRKSLLQDT